MTLLEVLKAWLADVTSDEPIDAVTSYGICGYIRVKYNLRTYYSLHDALKAAFEHDQLNEKYPFGQEDFYSRFYSMSMHRCPKRFAWVRETIKRLENKQCVNQY